MKNVEMTVIINFKIQTSHFKLHISNFTFQTLMLITKILMVRILIPTMGIFVISLVVPEVTFTG